MFTHYSKYFPATRRVTSDAAHGRDGYALLEQGGFVRGTGAAGVHYLLPLGWRVHRKICAIIFDEMERRGVLNLTLPILQQRELWEATNRWGAYVRSKTMFQTKEEHKGGEFGLAPTAEEMVTALVAAEVKSWRELPLQLHQIGPKFRDELRPRGGLLRGREFVMSDAYSFDRDEAGMRQSFEMYREIYSAIFGRLGLPDVISVEADSGAIGGSGSAEFMTLSDAGEDMLLRCDLCGYGANAEKADSRYSVAEPDVKRRSARRAQTPNVTTVEQLHTLFPDVAADQMIKTLIFAISDTASSEDSEPEETVPDLVAVCIRGDLTVNEVKLTNLIGRPVRPATDDEIEAATGAPVGFAGPIGLRGVGQTFFDASAKPMTNFLCGVNEADTHILDANFGSDVGTPSEFFALHLAQAGDGCPKCEGALTAERGIEIGHVFMLQRGYAAALGAKYSAEDGGDEIMWMGCYGIGTTRLLQAIAEKCRDSDGLVWPATVAPFDVHVVLTHAHDDVQGSLADEIGETLDQLGLAALLDDRAVSPGVKFKDADLIGCPVRVTVGRAAERGEVEVYKRGDKTTEVVPAHALAIALS